MVSSSASCSRAHSSVPTAVIIHESMKGSSAFHMQHTACFADPCQWPTIVTLRMPYSVCKNTYKGFEMRLRPFAMSRLQLCTATCQVLICRRWFVCCSYA